MVVVDLYQILLGVVAVVIMICVPILSVIALDLVVGRWEQTLEHRRGVRAMRHCHGRPIEQLAADLRRLRTDLEHDEHRSATHQIGSRLAYDGLLIEACAMLDVGHELDQPTGGMVREIERVRVEAALQSAGLVLTDHRRGQDVL